VAGQFVFGHGALIRRLPPSVTANQETLEQEEQFRYRDEEIGAKLETRLTLLGPQFVELRRRSWRSMQGGGVAGARIAMAGIRELSTDILHLLAPDEEVKKTSIWLQRKDLKITRPTRRMRIQFIAGPAAETFDALVQFDESMLHAHQFTHTFANDPELVRIALAQLENCIYMLLISSKL
jgi:Predicted pPIWI-associating nuclease